MDATAVDGNTLKLHEMGHRYGCPTGINILDFLEDIIEKQKVTLKDMNRTIEEGMAENRTLKKVIDERINHPHDVVSKLQRLAKKYGCPVGDEITDYLDKTIQKMKETIRVGHGQEDLLKTQLMEALAERDAVRDQVRQIAVGFGCPVSDGNGMISFLKRLSQKPSNTPFQVLFDEPGDKDEKDFKASQIINFGDKPLKRFSKEIFQSNETSAPMGPGLLEQFDVIFDHGTDGRKIQQEHPYGMKEPRNFSNPDSAFTQDNVFTGFDKHGVRWAGHYSSHGYEEQREYPHGVMFVSPIALVPSDNIALLLETVELYSVWSERTNDERLFLDQNERLRVSMEHATQPAPQPNWKEKSPSHYGEESIQPAEYIERNGLDFFQGNVVKYVTRHKAKDGAKDIKKAIHYLEMILENQYPKTECATGAEEMDPLIGKEVVCTRTGTALSGVRGVVLSRHKDKEWYIVRYGSREYPVHFSEFKLYNNG